MDEAKEEVKKKPRRTVRFSEVAEALVEEQKKKKVQEKVDTEETEPDLDVKEATEAATDKTPEIPVGAVAPFK